MLDPSSHRGVLFAELLAGTSRTFAAAIPLLAEPLRGQVSVSYLLFRAADTIEDASGWPVASRLGALRDFSHFLEGGPVVAIAPPGLDSHHQRLLASVPALIEGLRDSPGAVSAAVVRHLVRTTQGMANSIAHGGARGIELDSLRALRRYCYMVAGVVGELLTDLFVLAETPLVRFRQQLDRDAASFGEALQLVNILKDRDRDATEGRRFLPPGVPLASLFRLARADCRRAARYLRTLSDGGASATVRSFTSLPLALAIETLDALEGHGPATKLGRPRVQELLEEARQGALGPRLISTVP